MPRDPQIFRPEETIETEIQITGQTGSVAPTKARIHSAITKGKQTLLPCETKGLNLSKFEHKGRDGPLMVFAEEAYHQYNKFGHYKVITTVKPAESVRNRLFFGEKSSKHNKEVIMKQESSRVSVINRATKGRQQIDSRTVDNKKKHRERNPPRKQATNPDSFEALLARYKSSRAKNKQFMGTEHLEVLEKLDGLYRKRKQERLRLLAPFGDLGDIRTEINAITGLRDHVQDLEEASEEGAKESVRLPRIRVTTVTELTKKNSVPKLNRKRLVVPREKRGALNRGHGPDRLIPRIDDASGFETNAVSLPKI